MERKRILYTGLLLIASMATTQLMAQEAAKNDSVNNYPHYGNAFEHLLQKPIKVEKFDGKRLGDHFFIMAGAGTNLLESEGKYGLSTTLKVGDWITPVHGIRLGGNIGYTNVSDKKVAMLGAEVDYLMNLSALGAGKYSLRRPVELSLVLGGDFLYGRKNGINGTGLGVHGGFLGTVRLSDIAFFFVEPRIGLYNEKAFVLAGDTWKGYRAMGSLSLGLGYKLTSDNYRSHDVWESTGLPDNVFISAGLGTGAQVVKPLSSTTDNIGAFGTLAIGKMFDPYSSLRLKGKVGLFKTQNTTKLKLASAQADYLFNLTNLMGGYNEKRSYWLNGVIGGDLAFAKYDDGKFALGVGAGVQMNVKVGRYTVLYAEPRIDVYSDKYNPSATTAKNKDVVASLELGVTFMRNDASNRQLYNGDLLVRNSFWDNLFIQGGFGFSAVATRQLKNHLGDFLSPVASVAVGSWLDTYSGIRIYGDIRKLYRYKNDSGVKMVTGGIDYMWNLSNFIAGYDPERVFEVSASVGPRLGVRAKSNRFYVGAGASLQGLVHLNKMTALFVEPSLHTFKYDLLGGGVKFKGMGFTGNIMAGVQFTMRGYNPAVSNDEYTEDVKSPKYFMFVAGGPSTSANRLNKIKTDVKFGYGKWYNAAMAWRLTGNVECGEDYSRVAAGADWLLSLSTLTYGYNADRAVSLNALAGIGIGRMSEFDKVQFSPDLHFGGQMSFRLSQSIKLFVEPQVSLRFLTRKSSGKPFQGGASIDAGFAYCY